MKKRILSCLMALALCLTLLPTAALAEDGAWDGSIVTAFAGGTGTESDPYQIANGAELAYLASSVNNGETYEKKNFVLTANIDLNGLPWTPIANSFSNALFGGSDYRVFAGNFDGKGYTISNVSIGSETTPLESDVLGLFGATEGKISNLNLDTVSIHGVAKIASGYVVGIAGGLVGSSAGSIENCHVTGLAMDMSAPSNGYAAAYWVGGLVGALDGAQLINECSVSGSITEKAGKGSIGGLIGELGKTAKITYSRSNVTVNVKADSYGGADVGGFIGKGNGKTDAETVIRNCCATGDVIGGAYAGGFAGSLFGLNIKNCYATGEVTGAAASMATFAGTDASNEDAYGSVTNCYTTGTLSGKAAYMYAFTMQQEGTPRSPTENCYFADTNSALINLNETTVFKALAEMQTKGFKDTLNANDPANGWLFREGKTPLCGAEPADYSAVDAALAKIPADLTAYTDESIETLSAATEAVIRGKVIAKQAEVDTMAEAIENAIAALVKKPSSGGGFSSGSFFPSYPVNTPDKTENGTVTVSTKNAISGSTVTITVKPDDGFKLDDLTVTDKNGKELKLTDKGNGKYTFTMPASKVEVNATFVKEVETSPFSDVSTSAYYYEAVKWAQEKGITGGIGNGLFGPNQPCTRAQIVTFLWRAAGSPEPKAMSSFADVSTDAYYAKAVAWAVENGITTGTGDGKFSPDATCTRAQSVTFLFRAIGKLVDSKAEFSDVLTDSYYANAVAWAVENGVTNGIGDGLFGPDNSCTRAQIVTFLYRAYQGK